MDTQEKASWEVWVVRLLNVGTVAALGYFVLFVDFSNHGRIWDMLAARVPVLARIIPLSSHGAATVVTKSGPAAENPKINRTLIVNEQAPAVAASQHPTAESVPAPAKTTAAKGIPTPHLTSSLSPYNIHDNSQNTILSVPAAPAAQQPDQTAEAAPAPAPAQNTSAPVIAAKASYGAASRTEIMGQAAGPVYNLKGKKK